MMHSDVIVGIIISCGLFVFSQSHVKVSASLTTRCRVLVCCSSFSRLESVSSNKVSVVVVLEKNTFKVFVFVT